MIKVVILDFFGVVCGKGLWRTYEIAGGDLEKDHDYIEAVVDKEAVNAISNDEFHQMIGERLGMTAQEWKAIHDMHDGPNEDTLELIRELKKEYRIVLLSNAGKGVVQERLSTEQLALFDAVVVSGEVGFAKPNAKIYQYAAEKVGVDLNECVFTDDHAEYLLGAEAVGMKTILFSDAARFKFEFERLVSQHE
jgi:HAD superfamily hydrolase (TIGR01509 family)